MAKSPKNSMKGYSIKVWVIKNKDNIKLLIAAGLGIIAASFPNLLAFQAIFGGATAIGSKLIMDGIDFYCSSVDLN